VAESNLEFEICCIRVGVAYRGYPAGGEPLLRDPSVGYADPIDEELRIRAALMRTEDVGELGAWRSATPEHLAQAALNTSGLAGPAWAGASALPAPEREADSALACKAAIDALVASGADLRYTEYRRVALAGACCSARAGDATLAASFLRHWITSGQRHMNRLAPSEVLIPEALAPIVLAGAMRDEIGMAPEIMDAIAREIVAALEDRIAAGTA
jgi:hypothetical protein